MHVGFEEILILSVTMAIVAGIIALDASRFPDEAFRDVGTTRRAWQVGPIVLAFVTIGFGALVALIVWVSGRREEVVNAAAAIRAAAPAPEPPEAEPPEFEDPAPEPLGEPAQ